MIQWFASRWMALGRRRVSVLLLAVSLNLALVPCTMALEVVELGHDCCPPELQIEASECCELDDASIDARSGLLEPDDQPEADALPAHTAVTTLNSEFVRYTSGVDPPDPPATTAALHKLNCAYLI
jgi:hypothetical protein